MSLKRPTPRQLEIIAVIFGYVGLFVFFIGPFIGSTTGWTKPAISPTGRATLVHTFTSIRGWILIVTCTVVMFSYIYLRPRVTGHDPSTFWKDGE